jgi:hypothetical protein
VGCGEGSVEEGLEGEGAVLLVPVVVV